MKSKRLYRVTAFEPGTTHEHNVGLFVAASREDAISQATSRDRDGLRYLVLDAALVVASAKEINQ